jgi:chorismate mutase
MNTLLQLREQIDEIDERIMGLIEKRNQISKEIGDYKSANNLPYYQEKIAKHRSAIWMNRLGFRGGLLYATIHEISLNIQKEL